jgi:predicted metalloprotease with PDZ domain
MTVIGRTLNPRVPPFIEHEYFHAWNMMRIHSAEYRGLDYHPIQLSGLWFSDGATMY